MMKFATTFICVPRWPHLAIVETATRPIESATHEGGALPEGQSALTAVRRSRWTAPLFPPGIVDGWKGGMSRRRPARSSPVRGWRPMGLWISVWERWWIVGRGLDRYIALLTVQAGDMDRIGVGCRMITRDRRNGLDPLSTDVAEKSG
jgi:hypothetical protein